MEQQLQGNPFADAPVASRPNNTATVNSDQQRAVAEVQAAMMIARANPRDPIAAMDRILNACTRPGLAESAVYTYARGGSDISGPSIRLAETLAQQWGNFQFGIRELEQRNGESTVQAFAWDVETNTRREVTFQVQHLRFTRSGSKRLDDPRDIYEMVANQGARRLRACILAIIPGDVTEAAVAQCEATMSTKADTGPEAMHKMITAFEAFGVTREQIEKRIQRRIDSIQPAQVVSLKKVYASLRDGMSAPGDWFELAEGAQADEGKQQSTAQLADATPARTISSEKVKEALRAHRSKFNVDPETGETSPPKQTYAQYAERLNKTSDVDIAARVLDEARSLPADQRKELEVMYARKFKS